MTMRPATVLAGLVMSVLAALLLSIMVGAVHIPVSRLLALASGAGPTPLEAAVLWRIRLPRAALAIVAGAVLGAAGAAQQGLFRNPLADPALIGISAGAALGAVLVIVLGAPLAGIAAGYGVAPLLVPAAAFLGALAATAVALGLGKVAGFGAPGLLLAGIAVNAVAGAGTGLMVTISDDRQLRDITFWSMGSLASGGWTGAASAGACALVAAVLLWPACRPLDALLLGEAEAEALGVDVARLRRRVVAAVALGVGGAVAATGIIGFVGLVMPHLVRMLAGPRHALLLPASALLGATLLLLADTGARLAAAPAELPIGLVTSVLGGPFFILLLLHRRVRA